LYMEPVEEEGGQDIDEVMRTITGEAPSDRPSSRD
jgi:hypothetical protein